MKKILIILTIIFSLNSSVFAADEYQELLIKGIQNYKKENYLGTIQVMEKVVEDNPGSILAFYYLGMSYAQIGKTGQAKNAYNKVLFIDPNSQIAAYAELGLERLQPEKLQEKQKQSNEFMEKIQNNYYTENVEQNIKSRKLKYIIDQVNSNREIDHSNIKNFEDFTPDKSSKPTPEQIAQAYQTLKSAGLNIGQGLGQGVGMFNPEMMQMSMLAASMGGGMGKQSGNMNMLPFLMMMQNQNGQKNIDPDFMQTMISNMMMPDMMGLYENNNKY